MNRTAATRHDRAISGKVIVISLLACAVVFFAVSIIRGTFRHIRSTVSALSQPDQRIVVVNGLFRQVTYLSTLQNTEGATADIYRQHAQAMRVLLANLDTLRLLCSGNAGQQARIDSMKGLIRKREYFFDKYINLRNVLSRNDTLLANVQGMSQLIEKARPSLDSNQLVTTRDMKITIDTIPYDEKTTLWERLFTKKKPIAKIVQRREEEKLNVRVDTIAGSHNVDSLVNISARIAQIASARQVQRNSMRQHKTRLDVTDAMFTSQLMRILKDIETDELQHAQRQNRDAEQMVNGSLQNTGFLLAGFIACSAILLVMIFSDIARSRKYKKQLIAAREEAEEAGRIKQRFLANMSHELRTPLQAIVGIAEQMADDQVPEKEDAEKIYSSSRHLLQIVNEVLDYSRITSGKMTLEQKPFSVSKVADEVVGITMVQAQKKHLALLYENNVPRDMLCMGDEFRLRQVLLNLMGNAVKFTAQGSVALHVSCTKRAADALLFEFKVSDTGIGIHEDDIKVIFNEFEQGKNVHGMHGTGLGLSIAREITEMHGGRLTVERSKDKGTTFCACIPYSPGVAEDKVISHRRKPCTGHVWIVDDDALILQLCSRILSKYAIPHTCFRSAEEALTAAFPSQLSTVLLDIRMAGMDGITLCRKLKERDDIPPTLTFVAFTAQALPQEKTSLLHSGFDKLLIKPFLENNLLDIVGAEHSTDPEVYEQPDLSAIISMSGGDEEAVPVLKTFVAQTTADVHAIHHSAGLEDEAAIADILHRLASRMGQVGALAIANGLRAAETELRNGLLVKSVLAGVEALMPAIAHINIYIEDWCNANCVATKC